MLALRQGPLLVRRRSTPKSRLTEPMVEARRRRGRRSTGRRRSSSSASGLERVREGTAAAALGALVSPHSTLEELHLAQKLMRGLGSDNIDFRLRQTDFRGDGQARRASSVARACRSPNLPSSTACWSSAASCARITRCSRSACARRRRRARRSPFVHSVDDELLIAGRAQGDRRAVALPRALAEIVVAAARARGQAGRRRRSRASSRRRPRRRSPRASLAGKRKAAILPRQLRASSIRDASQLHALAQALAEITGATLGFLTEAANSRRRLPRRRAAAAPAA